MIEIKIADENVDFELQEIEVSKQLADFERLDTRYSTSSRQIKLIASDRTRSVLGHYEDMNSADAIDDTVLKEVKILIDGEIKFKGKLKILKAVFDEKSKSGYYDIQMISNNGDWATQLKSKSMRDLDLSDLDHSYDIDTILALNTAFSTDKDVCYPLVHYGAFSGGTTAGGDEKVSTKDLYPALSLQLLIKRIFNEIGWTLSSSYLFDTADVNYKKILPFTGYLLEHSQNEYGFLDALGFAATSPINGIPAGTGNRYTSGKFIRTLTARPAWSPAASTVSQRGYRIVRDCKVNIYLKSFLLGSTIPDCQMYVSIFDENDVVKTTYSKSHTNVFGASLTIFPKYVDVKAGDKICFSWLNWSSGTGHHVVNVTQVNCNIEVINQNAGVDSNEIYDLANNLPDMTQFDFMKGIMNWIGLIPDADSDARSISLELFKEYYGLSKDAEDYSNKLDINGELISQNLELARKYLFSYKNDDEYFIEQFRIQKGFDLGTHEETTDTLLTSDIKEFQAFFSATLSRIATDINLDAEQIPHIWRQPADATTIPDKKTEWNHRVLQWVGNVNLAGGRLLTYYKDEDASDLELDNFWTAHFVQSDYSVNLSYKSFLHGYGYYDQSFGWLVKLYEQSKKRICKLLIDGNTFDTFDFSKVVQINENYEPKYYYVQRLGDFSIINQRSIEVELYKYIGTYVEAELQTFIQYNNDIDIIV
jgi:hypothetical protein